MTDPVGLRRDVGEKHQRGRQAAFLFMKMVLGNPCAVEADALRVADLFGRQQVARLRRALVEQTGKKTEAFRHYAFSV